MAKRRLSPSHRIRRSLRNQYKIFHPNNEKYRWFLLANIMIGTFMAVLDATIVNVGLPKIMAAFGVSIDKIEWVITAYMLAMAVMLPTSGWLADRFGYKKVYFWGLFAFTLGSFLCGVSHNEGMLIFSRVIQGLGAGFLMPVGMAIITREFPPDKRGIALGFWAIAAAASVSFGPLIGGYLVDNFSWQLIFDVNVPIGILGMIVTIIIQKEYKNKNIKGFDAIGFISVSIFLPVLLYALSEGTAASNSAGWSAPYILLCFAIATVMLAVFITVELTKKNPLIELRLMKDYNFAIGNLVMFIFGIGMFGSTFLLPLYLQNSLDYTAIQAGAVFLPVGIIQGAFSPISGMIADKTNPKIPILLGIILLAVSFFINGYLSYMTEHWYIMTSLYIRGFAMGILFTPLSTVSLLSIPRDKMAQASGLFNVIRQIGGSLGVALFATILTARVSFHSQTYSESIQTDSPVFASVTRKLAHHVIHDAGSTPGDAMKKSQYILLGNLNKQAFIQGVDDDFLMAGFITLLGGIPIILLRTRKKKKEEENKQSIAEI